jgi:hypothetical protein
MTRWQAAGMRTITVPMVHVDLNSHGQWEVAVPEASERIRCETLEAATSVAYLCAERSRPCELVVRDAYHRVLQRELIDDQVDR